MRDSRSCWCTVMRRNDSLLSREPTRGRTATALVPPGTIPSPSLPLGSRRWMTYRASFHLPKVRGMSWKMEQMLPLEPCPPSSGNPRPALHLHHHCSPSQGQGLRGPGNCTEHPTWVTPPPPSPSTVLQSQVLPGSCPDPAQSCPSPLICPLTATEPF